MKRWLSAFLVLIPAILLLGCNAGVKNPPVFIEMYLNPASVLSETGGLPETPEGWLLLEETTTTTEEETTTTVTTGPEDAGDIYSESDFEVVVVTNGANYDLLFSVELTDSELGPCVYTDQSTLYHATSTIEVQKDGTYNTVTVLTIPGSAVPETYLSERTITLSKILFTRDTVDGTFPADIPENTDTSLLFTVHALEYFDPTVGLPVRVNADGKLDIVLTPDSPFYAAAQAAAVAVVDLPSTLNGYPIGKIWLEDLPWVTEMSLSGGTDHCFLLGDFSSLESLAFDAFYFSTPQETRHITMTGTFSSLETLEFNDIQGFRVFVGRDNVIDLTEYDDYLEAVPTPDCDFTALKTVDVWGSHLGILRIGRDFGGFPTPEQEAVVLDYSALETVTIDESGVSDVELGGPTTDFSALASFAVTDSSFGTVYVAGTKPAEAAGAAITYLRTTQEYTLYLSGSAVSTMTFTASELGGLDLDDAAGEVPSKLSAVTLTDSDPADSQGSFNLHGVFPALLTLNLADFALGEMRLGDVGSVFDALTTISLSGLTGSNLWIGERDASFPALTEITITNCAFQNVRIGRETAAYPLLEEIRVEGCTITGDLVFGYMGGVFTVLELIDVLNTDVGDELLVGPGTTGFPALDAVMIRHTDCVTFGLFVYAGTYELFFENSTATVNFGVAGSEFLTQIFVSENPATSWAHYAYATDLGIPVVTGTGMPA